MGSKELKTRDQIDSRYKWNIEAMMPDEGIIDGELEKIKDAARAYTERFSGHLADSGETLLAAFEEKDSIWRRLEKIYVYAHMKRDEDNGSSKYQGMTDKAVSVIAAVGAAMSFFTPELLAADEAVLLKYTEETPGLDTYEFVIKDALRQKKHVLSSAEETLMAQM